MVTVRAVQPLTYEGSVYQVGDQFQTTIIDALRLRGQGKISLSPRPQRAGRVSVPAMSSAQADVTTPDSIDAPDPTPATVTRELTADAPTETPPPTRTRRRRQYRRTELDVDETTELDAED